MIVALLLLAASAMPDCRLCFYGPDNLAFGKNGDIYVTDSFQKSRFRVLKLSKNGRKLGEWKMSGAAEGITVGPSGNVFVTDGGALRILQLTPGGKIVASIGGFHDLGHVAVDARGFVYASEGGADRIRKFSPAGELVGTLGNDWKMPEGIAIRPDGALVVEDWGHRRVVILLADGKSLQVIEGVGVTAGMAVDRRGNVYLADEKLHRVREFGADGQLVRTIAGAGLFNQGPSSIAVDRDGNLYAADGLSVVKFSLAGKVLARWR